MPARCASLHHRDLAPHPGAGVLDRLAWSWILRLSRLEEVKNVLCARCGPESEANVSTARWTACDSQPTSLDSEPPWPYAR